jgi:PIN domain nuclease of toxin-antitoxin system
MNYVTDTHSIVWYFTENSSLSERALEVFEKTVKENGEIIIIPSIVLAEIMFIATKGKITLTFEETLQKIDSYDNFIVAVLDVEILKVADRIKADLEMHDKLIAATALYHNAFLITKDPMITDSEVCTIIW